MFEQLISVVVPVYNGERTLARCLESICKQTYTALEIIVVDDGSEDRTTEICQKYAQLDSRIRAIRQVNAGASAARNRGLEEARGNYLTFVDADDELIDNELYQSAVEAMQNYHSDVAIWSWEKKDGYGSEQVYMERADRMPAAQIAETIIKSNCLCGGGYPWNKIWRMEKLKDKKDICVRFDEDLFAYEDKLFILQCLTKMNCGTVMDRVGYRYYASPESLSRNRERFIEISKNGIIAHEKITSFYHEINSVLEDTAVEHWALVVLVNTNYARKNDDDEFLKWLNPRMKMAKNIILTSRKIGLRDKVKCLYNWIYLKRTIGRNSNAG